ncbi:hypothetical protein ACFTRD_30010 [Paenibacillus sp. NPDC056933]|uniref:hypothetical protein n=1 Tax=Paenibacillus sp. NPDC056933 TaxID=3345968 RepID=UPI00362E527A
MEEEIIFTMFDLTERKNKIMLFKYCILIFCMVYSISGQKKHKKHGAASDSNKLRKKLKKELAKLVRK